MKKIIMLGLLSVHLFGNSLSNGVTALKNGDYTSAMESFMILAESGNVIAQQNLGVMYKNGLGVKKDNYKAAYWFTRASDKDEYVRVSTICQ